MRAVLIHLPEGHVKLLDKLVNDKVFPNRSEAIRVAVRDLIKFEFEKRLRNV